MRAHAVLGASSAHRWLECTPSARINAELPATTNQYAETGTLAHEIGEYSLLLHLNRITDEVFKAKYTEWRENEHFYNGILEDVKDYIDFVIEAYHEALAVDEMSTINLEERLDYSMHVPDGFGTGDTVIISGNTIHIIDLKFGKNLVEAYENPQLKLYAIGAYEKYSYMYDIKEIKLSIVMPRVSDGTSSFIISTKDLLKWLEETVKPAAELAHKGEGERVAGNHCKYCKVGSYCATRAKYYTERYEKAKEGDLSFEEIGELLSLFKPMQAWIKEVSEYALKEAMQGTEIEGWKVVEGRSNRKIIDEDAAAKVLKSKKYKVADIYKPRTLQTIGNLEKLVGKKSLAEMLEGILVKPKGSPTLAPITDKRPSIANIEDELNFD